MTEQAAAAGSEGAKVEPIHSPISQLRKQVEEARQSRWQDVPIRGTDIKMRLFPVEPAELEAIRKKYEGNADEIFLSSAAALVASCQAIFRGDDPDDSPYTFSSPDLAQGLGVETGRAVDVVRAAFVTEGDVVRASEKVLEVSGIVESGEMANLIRKN